MPEKIEIAKFQKLLVNFYDKREYMIHIKDLKKALNHGLVLKKWHGVIKFNQNENENT